MPGRAVGPYAVLAAALLCVPGLCAAQGAGGTPAHDKSWYGWQIALADLGALGAFAAMNHALKNPDFNAAERTATPWMLLGGALYAGGPAIHAAHRNPAAGRSALLRLLLPLGGGILLGAAAGKGVGAATAGLYGVAAGGISAIVIDWVSAVEPGPEPVPPPSPSTADGVQTRVEITPTILLAAKRSAFGLTVRF